ncbi:hypothetical protein ACFSKW_09685 [Nonomuraea mangrovi]|uniref:DUF8094 domain-containing protein n=1 Tax=Nonomuraea mangrovi TaxID=2316207 RepID=A0ABW4SSC4_9ACTN
MRAYGRRGWAALAAGVLAAATACSASGAPQPSPVAATVSVTPTPTTAPGVSLSEAANAFSEYILTDDLLRAAGDRRLAREITRDGRTDLANAEYASTRDRPARYAWGAPSFLVPRLRPDEPLWFTVVVPRDGRTAVLTFAKGTDWRLSSLSLLMPGEKLPEMKRDAAGYAETVGLDDKSVQISPRYVAPLHATIAERGPAGIAANLVAPGIYTTETAATIADNRTDAKTDGFRYDSIFTPADFPVYALRTVDGGALVQYSLLRTTSMTNVVFVNPFLPIPPDGRWALARDSYSHDTKIYETQQYVAALPPAAAATVIGYDGAITRANGT